MWKASKAVVSMEKVQKEKERKALAMIRTAGAAAGRRWVETVSYTHLTLPTILLV